MTQISEDLVDIVYRNFWESFGKSVKSRPVLIEFFENAISRYMSLKPISSFVQPVTEIIV